MLLFLRLLLFRLALLTQEFSKKNQSALFYTIFTYIFWNYDRFICSQLLYYYSICNFNPKILPLQLILFSCSQLLSVI